MGNPHVHGTRDVLRVARPRRENGRAGECALTSPYYPASSMHAVPLSPPCTPTCHQVVYGHKVDVWAIGVVAYELLYGTLPFGLGEDPSEDFEVRPRLPNA